MKTILFVLFLPLACLAQHPLVTGAGIDWRRATTAAPFDPSTVNGLFIELLADNILSQPTNTDGSNVKWWTNVAPPFASGNDSYISRNASHLPVYHSGSPPYVDFSEQTTANGTAGNVRYMSNGNTYGTNQPITWYAVLNQPDQYDTNATFKSSVIFDVSTGGSNRELWETFTGGAATWEGAFNAGTATIETGLGSYKNLGQWVVWTAVFNGASSVIYTNNVQLGNAGNPGSQGIGQTVLIGTDQTFSTQGTYKLACLLCYTNAHDSTTRNTVVSGLKTRYNVP